MENLKPCPFCGNRHPSAGVVHVSTGWKSASVFCEGCAAQIIRHGDTEGEAIEYVVEAWNNRLSEAAVNLEHGAWSYQFPECMRHERTTSSQIRRIEDEVEEAYGAMNCEDCITELLDVIHCTETALRMKYDEYISLMCVRNMSPRSLDDFKAEVIEKNRARGYYD